MTVRVYGTNHAVGRGPSTNKISNISRLATAASRTANNVSEFSDCVRIASEVRIGNRDKEKKRNAKGGRWC